MKRNVELMTLAISLVLCVVSAMYFYINSTNQIALLHNPRMDEINSIYNVMLIDSNQKEEYVTLPVKRDSDKTYSFSFVMPINNIAKSYININTRYISFIISNDNHIIYEKKQKPNYFVKSMGSSFNLVEIPKKYEGKTLTITFISNIDSQKIIIPDIKIGSKASILLYYIQKGNHIIFSFVALIISALSLFLISLFYIKIKHSIKKALLLSFYSFIAGFCILARTWLIYYLFDNNVAMYFIEYMTLLAIPLPVILLFLSILYESEVHGLNVKLLEVTAVLVTLNFVVQTMLTITGISEFIEMKNFIFISYLCTVIAISLGISTVDNRKVKYKNLYVISIIPISISSTIAMFVYYKPYAHYVSISMVLSMIFLISIHFYISVQDYLNKLNASIESEFYEELAYKDVLTKIANRNKLESDIDITEKMMENYKNVYIFVIDINNLKIINDNLGHYFGDQYIKEAGDILKIISEVYDNTSVYRIGGDEFILITFNKTQKDVEDICHQINTLSNEFKCRTSDIPLSLAIGYECMDQNDNKSLKELIEIADKKMYLHKNNIKESFNE